MVGCFTWIIRHGDAKLLLSDKGEEREGGKYKMFENLRMVGRRWKERPNYVWICRPEHLN